MEETIQDYLDERYNILIPVKKIGINKLEITIEILEKTKNITYIWDFNSTEDCNMEMIYKSIENSIIKMYRR